MRTESRAQRFGTKPRTQSPDPSKGQDADSQLKLLTTANQTPTVLWPGNPLLKWLTADPSPDTSRMAMAGPLGQIGQRGEVSVPTPWDVWENPPNHSRFNGLKVHLSSNPTLNSQGGESWQGPSKRQTSVGENPPPCG